MLETSPIFHDQGTGLIGFRLELGNDSSGAPMQARRLRVRHGEGREDRVRPAVPAAGRAASETTAE